MADLYPESPLMGSSPPEDVPLCEMLFQISLLHESDVGYIVLHKAYLSAEDVEAWRRALRLNPVFEDEILLVYETQLDPC